MDRQELADDIRAIGRRGLRPGSPAALAFAVVCVAAATLVRMAIDLIAPGAVPFSTYFPAILIAAMVGGIGAGVLTMALGGLLSWFMFMPPRLDWTAFTTEQIISLALYAVASIIVIWVANGYRAVMRRLYEEERYRKIVVDELGHRVKNKLATIHAILRHELRGHEAIWDSVSGRLQALSAADDFIVQADGAGVELRRILEMEMEPYGSSKITLRGDPVFVFGKMPSVLALVFHELTTNAAKYGSLSSLEGRVEISWNVSGDTISIVWAESGGPAVAPPKRRSFGSNLIERSLDAFGGSARIEFAAAGVICRIRLPRTDPPETVADRTTLSPPLAG